MPSAKNEQMETRFAAVFGAKPVSVATPPKAHAARNRADWPPRPAQQVRVALDDQHTLLCSVDEQRQGRPLLVFSSALERSTHRPLRSMHQLPLAEAQRQLNCAEPMFVGFTNVKLQGDNQGRVRRWLDRYIQVSAERARLTAAEETV